jgi:hypothetical protein
MRGGCPVRTAWLCSLATFAVIAPAHGQVRSDARTSVLGDVELPRYKVTREGGETFYVVSFTKKPPWYVFTDTHSKKQNQLMTSVAKIEPLPEAEAEKVVDAYRVADDGSASARLGARVEARTKARVSAPSSSRKSSRSSRRADPDPPFLPYSPLSAGASPTGLPLFVGPRGGIYHYSANGNKVYHSRN